MQTIGVILLIVGVVIGFGAKRIMLKNCRVSKEERDEEFFQLIDKGTIYIKVTGFVIAIIGFLFIFL
ncbi:hypothetical protein [Defluviitalea phaphyphila]|uniref:hypothetical protein n=1 Tax=Defluviitalea phaphyphila TaxID=1473580 RepID=UPI0007310B26|nr:hypothetical protein [Defluviitalea phaphyphila]